PTQRTFGVSTANAAAPALSAGNTRQTAFAPLLPGEDQPTNSEHENRRRFGNRGDVGGIARSRAVLDVRSLLRCRRCVPCRRRFWSKDRRAAVTDLINIATLIEVAAGVDPAVDRRGVGQAGVRHQDGAK